MSRPRPTESHRISGEPRPGLVRRGASTVRGTTGRTFRSLRVYNYRLFFFSQVISMSGTWMQSVAQAWLMLQLTGSSVDLGILVGLQFGPVLVFGAWAGALADRVDKRRLLLLTQSAAALFALVLGILTATDVVTVWMIWTLAAFTGTSTALDMPSRQSFVYEMVGPDDVSNAVGLNSVIINSSRIIGPALGGVLIASVGVAPCFFLNAGSFVAVIVALLVMRPGELHRGKSAARGRGLVREGLRYVWHTPELRIPLLMMAVISTLAYNYSVVLPLLTKNVFGRGGGAYGALSAAMGIGALAGALLMASRAHPSRRVLVAAAFAFGVVTVGLAVTPTYYWAMVVLLPLGAAGVLFISTTNALLQVNSRDAMRGRVMALYSIVFLGSTPIGGPLTGLMVRGFGVRWAVAAGGVAALATALGAYWALRRRRLRAGSYEAPACLPDDPAALRDDAPAPPDDAPAPPDDAPAPPDDAAGLPDGPGPPLDGPGSPPDGLGVPPHGPAAPETLEDVARAEDAERLSGPSR